MRAHGLDLVHALLRGHPWVQERVEVAQEAPLTIEVAAAALDLVLELRQALAGDLQCLRALGLKVAEAP